MQPTLASPRDPATDLDEGAGVDYFDRQIGAGLRNARRRRGLTLRQVSALSEGRFKATSVAGYERGERAISLRRFVDLAELYGVPPPTLLAEIMRTVEPAPEPDVDLTALEVSASAEEALVAGFVRQIRALRRQHATGTISLRAGDLEVLGTAAAKRLGEILQTLVPQGEPRP